MVNYACGFSVSETEKYFEWIMITFILFLQEKEMQNHTSAKKKKYHNYNNNSFIHISPRTGEGGGG